MNRVWNEGLVGKSFPQKRAGLSPLPAQTQLIRKEGRKKGYKRDIERIVIDRAQNVPRYELGLL